MTATRFFTKLFLISLLSLTACNEYWWTRGQPPSANQILKNSISRVTEIKEEFNNKRPEISVTAEKLAQEFESYDSNNPKQLLTTLEDSLKDLEGKLSYGNRAPYNELLGQLRSFKNKTDLSDSNDAMMLYFARVLFFLSTEMKVPAPDPVAKS